MNKLLKIRNYIFPVIGVILIIFAEHITRLVPYILGGAMVLVGILKGIAYLRNKRFLDHISDEAGNGVVLFIMGTAFLIQGENSLVPLGITWAIIGIRKASKSLNSAIQQIYLKKCFTASVLEFVIRIALALVLLFRPFEKFSAHVAILGMELIVTNIRFSREENKAY